MEFYLTILVIVAAYSSTVYIALIMYNNYLRHKFLLKDRTRPYAIAYSVRLNDAKKDDLNDKIQVIMINAKPTELISKIKEQVKINWRTHTFHLVRCHALT